MNFAGLGSSGLTASEFYYRAMRMGIKGLVSTDAHQMKISASLLSSNDMFVAISNSGKQVSLSMRQNSTKSRRLCCCNY